MVARLRGEPSGPFRSQQRFDVLWLKPVHLEPPQSGQDVELEQLAVPDQSLRSDIAGLQPTPDVLPECGRSPMSETKLTSRPSGERIDQFGPHLLLRSPVKGFSRWQARFGVGSRVSSHPPPVGAEHDRASSVRGLNSPRPGSRQTYRPCADTKFDTNRSVRWITCRCQPNAHPIFSSNSNRVRNDAGLGERKWSGRRASNPLPQPWQGCALPIELLPLDGDGLGVYRRAGTAGASGCEARWRPTTRPGAIGSSENLTEGVGLLRASCSYGR